jgi:hypothetical protein
MIASHQRGKRAGSSAARAGRGMARWDVMNISSNHTMVTVVVALSGNLQGVAWHRMPSRAQSHQTACTHRATQDGAVRSAEPLGLLGPDDEWNRNTPAVHPTAARLSSRAAFVCVHGVAPEQDAACSCDGTPRAQRDRGLKDAARPAQRRSTIETIQEVRLKQFCARFNPWVEQASQPAS